MTRKQKRSAIPAEPTERRIAADDAKVELIISPCPDHLDEEARIEWTRFVGMMTRTGVDVNAYRAPLAIYCVAWSRWRKAERNITATGGEIVKSPSGFPIQNPWLSVAHRAQAQMNTILRSFR